MSKSIDALILTNKAYDFSNSVDSPLISDNEQGLWQLKHAPETVTDTEQRELWAGEIYIKLGAIAHTLSTHELPDVLDPNNPIGGIYMRKVDDILPERTESLLPEIPGHDLGLDKLRIDAGTLYTHDFLVLHPELIPEFLSKNGVATRIITNRRKKEEDAGALEYFHAGRNASKLLDAALADLDLIAHAFRRMDEWSKLDS